MDPTEAPLFFATPGELRDWFAEHHDTVDEQWVGFYKRATGLPSISWPESVDQALCFGWIDGIRKRIDEQAYKIRFTPRRRGSHWSAKNLTRIVELIEMGLVEEPGLEAYGRRDPGNAKQASYEQGNLVMPADFEARIRAHPDAWAYFSTSRPSYRKQVTWWVVSAKKEATQLRRLGVLIESCREGRLIPAMRWTKKSGG